MISLMRSAVVTGVQTLELLESEMPQQKDDHVLVNVLYVGICKTDWSLFRDQRQNKQVLGHEVVCQINQGSRAGFYVLNNEVPCGLCRACRQGQFSLCSNLTEFGVNRPGGYASHLLVPMACLYPIVLEDLRLGIFAEPTACAIRAVERLIKMLLVLGLSNATVAIVGLGVAGRLILLLLRLYQADLRILVLDTNPEVLKGIEHLHDGVLFSDQTPMADIVVECSGTRAGLETACKLVHSGGCVLQYGVLPNNATLPVSISEFHRREITIMTSLSGCTSNRMLEAIKVIESQTDFFKNMVGNIIGLDDLKNELTHWKPRAGTRTVVSIGEPHAQ
jgi:threonine dehydrogenase-like Zn-dependent dehydrogenase